MFALILAICAGTKSFPRQSTSISDLWHLLTDKAFRALLPAYLFHSLRHLSDQNKVLEWTLYTLCAVYDEDDKSATDVDAKLRKRIAGV